MEWSRMNPFSAADKKAAGMNDDPAPNKNSQQQDDGNRDTRQQQDPNKDGGIGNDPLYKFENLWQPITDKDGKEVQTDNRPKQFLPQLDQAKFGEMVGKMNFATDFTQEELEAVKGGGDNAVAAIVSLINKAGRRAFQTSVAASSKMAESGFGNARNSFMSEVPEQFRSLMTENMGDSPYAKDPALAPIVKQVRSQYLKKFPRATAGEINGAVDRYFEYIGQATSKKQGGDQPQDDNKAKLRRGSGDADFEAWLGDEIGGSNTNLTDVTQQ